MECCELCQRKTRSSCASLLIHRDFKDQWSRRFEREYSEAQREVQRLQRLYKEVCWYHFETQCREWRDPWFTSFGASVTELHGVRMEQVWRNGRLAEQGTFPIYYRGMIQDAPPLPPEIVLTELKAAKEYMHFMNEQRFAPYDWAPGGRKYEQMLRESEGVRAFNNLRHI